MLVTRFRGRTAVEHAVFQCVRCAMWSLTVVTTWTSVAVPWPTLTAWQLAMLLAMQLAARVESALEARE